MALGDPSGDARAEREVPVADLICPGERSAVLEAGLERREDLVVERRDAGAVVPLHPAPPRRSGALRRRVGEYQRQVEHLRAGDLGEIVPLAQIQEYDDAA